MKMIAVDPGDVHVGVAFFERDDENVWRCVDAIEFEPEEFADSLAESIIDGDVDVLVYESFRLYADKANQQAGSEFLTSQLIGVMKWLVRNHNKHVGLHAEAEKIGKLVNCELPGGVCNDARKVPKKVGLITQRADIKKPTAGILRTRKIKSVAKSNSRSNHCVDAELHGWHWILNGAG